MDMVIFLVPIIDRSGDCIKDPGGHSVGTIVGSQ